LFQSVIPIRRRTFTVYKNALSISAVFI